MATLKKLEYDIRVTYKKIRNLMEKKQWTSPYTKRYYTYQPKIDELERKVKQLEREYVQKKRKQNK